MIKSASFILLMSIMVVSMGKVTGYLWDNHSPQIEEEQPIYRPDFSLVDLQGKMHSNAEWDGKLVIINFWATWCPPCVKEIPTFIELQEKYAERGLQFIGIAINDHHQAITKFVEQQGINYPILQGEDAIDIAIHFGNRLGGLPFTVIIDRTGNIVLRHIGELKPSKAEQTILSFL